MKALVPSCPVLRASLKPALMILAVFALSRSGSAQHESGGKQSVYDPNILEAAGSKILPVINGIEFFIS